MRVGRKLFAGRLFAPFVGSSRAAGTRQRSHNGGQQIQFRKPRATIKVDKMEKVAYGCESKDKMDKLSNILAQTLLLLVALVTGGLTFQ